MQFTAREARLFSEAIIDPEGGKTGIKQFMDKVAPPLPVRRDGVWIDAEHEMRAQALEAAGELLPVGAPFYPGVTPIPRHQYAFGIARDPDTGQPRCHRDDTNPSPTDKQVLRALEPNDLPPSAISLSNPLMADPPTSSMGSPYEICSDRSAPNVPDVDVFRFKLSMSCVTFLIVSLTRRYSSLSAASAGAAG